MSKGREVSDLISKSTIKHYAFFNGYLSFLIQFVRNMNKSIHDGDTDLLEMAERSVAIALTDLKNYQSSYKTIKRLYNYYIIHFSLLSYSDIQLINELHYLIDCTYRNEYWKRMALEALDSPQTKLPTIHFDPTPMRRSTPWLSELLKKKGEKQNENVH